MKILAIAATVAIAVTSLSGCALFSKEPPPSIFIQYEATKADKTGLIRAFDMNGNTVLQFLDIEKSKPAIYAGDEKTPVTYQLVGQQMAIFPGLFPLLRVSANGAEAIVEREKEVIPVSAPND